MALEQLRARIAALATAPARALPRAAARIQAKFRANATTKRGNVPLYGRMGDIPIEAVVEGDEAIRVTAADWVMGKARELGQQGEWAAIVREEIAAEVRR